MLKKKTVKCRKYDSAYMLTLDVFQSFVRHQMLIKFSSYVRVCQGKVNTKDICISIDNNVNISSRCDFVCRQINNFGTELP